MRLLLDMGLSVAVGVGSALADRALPDMEALRDIQKWSAKADPTALMNSTLSGGL